MKFFFTIIFIFLFSCQEKSIVKQGVTSVSTCKMTAKEHLQSAKEKLRTEEGRLMVLGRGLDPKERKRYDFLLETGASLEEIIKNLDKTKI